MHRNKVGWVVPKPAGRVYSHAERLRVVAGILTCILLSALDQTVVLPAIPQMAATLRGGAHLSWVVAAYLLTTTATTPIYGKLSDQLGRRAVLVPALGLFILASILCALAGTVTVLIVARALQGVGGGALLAVAQAAVADVIPPRERGRYQAWFAGTWAFSSIAGPIAGGLVTQHLSWRWIFWANIPLGLIAMVLCIRGLAGLTAAGARGRIDYLGAALLVFSVAAILLAVSSGGVDFPWASWEICGFCLAGLVGFVCLSRQQRRAAAPILPGALLGAASFRGVLLVGFLNAASLFGAIFLLPLLFQGLYHASPAASGLQIVPFLFATTVGAFLAGQTTRITGRTTPVLAAGVGLAAFGFLPMAVLPVAASLWVPIGISAVFGMGLGMVMPTSLVAAQNQAPTGAVGAATGVLLLSRAMGGAFGATLAGAFLAIHHHNQATGFRLGFLSCAALEMLATFIALRMADVPLRTTVEIVPAAAD
jgi:EmrB/QacA subfamily drug resistance transporter